MHGIADQPNPSSATLAHRLGLLRGRDVRPASPDSDIAQRIARLKLLATEARPSTPRGDGRLPGETIAPGLVLIERKLGALQALKLRLDLPETLLPDWHEHNPVPRERLLFFDTETSGLNGGAGLKVFMLGVLRWRDGWTLKQYILSDPDGEGALVEAWLAEVSDQPVLVSYNGKRFDIPALATLERLHGESSGAAEFAHWDLLYPVRRRFRKVWPNCRLQTAERLLLNKHRVDDMPGSEAPRAWRDFLRFGHTHALLEIARHNRSDLESLIALLRQIGTHGPWTLP